MKKLSSAKIDDVLSLMDNGLSYPQIHERTGVSLGSISALRLKYRPTSLGPLVAGQPTFLPLIPGRQSDLSLVKNQPMPPRLPRSSPSLKAFPFILKLSKGGSDPMV